MQYINATGHQVQIGPQFEYIISKCFSVFKTLSQHASCAQTIKSQQVQQATASNPSDRYRTHASRAVTIHQTHDSVRITIFDPRFGSYHDFFVGGGRKKRKIFKTIFFIK